MRSRILTFTILLIFLGACKDDKIVPDDNASDGEKLFFQDYRPPMYKWGYLNIKGSLIIQDEYDDARDFSEGLAAVNQKGKWGYINKAGELIIPFQFRAAGAFSCGLAKVQDFEYHEYYIEKNGNIPFQINGEELSSFSDCRARIFNDPYYFFINNNGKVISDTTFVAAANFKNGYGKVKSEDGWNVIDPSGGLALNKSYDKCDYPSDGMVKVKEGSIIKYITLADQSESTEFKQGTNYHNGVAAIVKNGYVLVDKQGNQLSKAYDALQFLENDRWLYFRNEKCGLLTNNGEELTPAIYDIIYRFDDKATAYSKGDMWGVIDTNGNEITGPVFPLMWEFKDGMARAIFNGGVGFIDQSGFQVIPPYFIEVRDFSEGMARVQVIR
ncbi:MAG: WG repeat-containing protein [Saprospiraceae bacterium]|nr:WG repeat-containing protein [Saprospiraceae bacterium]